MTPPDWGALAREISEELWKNKRKVDLTYFLEEMLESRNLLVEGEAAEKFDSLKRQIRSLVEKKIQQCWARGIQPRYKTTSDPDVLIPMINPSAERIRHEITSTIKGLSTRQFECFCVHVLTVNGVYPCAVGAGRKEEGIDLYGVLDIGEIRKTSVWHGVRVRILGQAKTSTIGQPAVRQFHTDLSTCSKGEGRAFQLAPPWFKELRGAVLGIVMSGEKFSDGALKWAAREAVVTKDAEQMIEDLVTNLHMTAGIRGSADNVEFDKQVFIDHLNKIDADRDSSR